MIQGISRLSDHLFVRYVRSPDHPCKLRFVRWLCRKWFTQLTALTESGLMVLDSQDLIQSALLQYGHFEPGTCELHRRLLKPGDTYLDIGANVGVFSLLASQCVGSQGRVVAVEPNPPIFARLLQNLKLNPFAANITPFCCALSDAEGFARLRIPPAANSGLARLTSSLQEDAFTVSTKTPSSLLDFAGVRTVTLLKIDVEGHELPILSQLLASGISPAHIIFEYLPDEFPEHRTLLALLRSSGYMIQTLAGVPCIQDEVAENNLWAARGTDVP